MSGPGDHPGERPRDDAAAEHDPSDGIRSPAQAVAPGRSELPGDERPAVVAAPRDPTPEGPGVPTLLEHSIGVPVLAAAVEQQRPADAADTLEGLAEQLTGDAGGLLVAMDDQKASEALAHMEVPLAAGVVEDLVDEGSTDHAARLLELMDPDDAVDLLGALRDPVADACLAAMPPASASGLRRLLGYDEETAAGLMTTRYLALREQTTIGEATESVRRFDLDEHISHLPVVDAGHHLVGIVSLRMLLVNRDDRLVGSVMHRKPRAIRADLDREDVAREFERHDFQMMPVVDERDRVIGVVTVDDVIDIIRDEQTEDGQRSVGAGKGEAVYSGVVQKFRGRFPWLAMSVLMMIPSALVVRRFEGLIDELAILAVLMPVVAAGTGNAGHQALAVTLRGIVLDEVRPGRVLPLIRRETVAGLCNGLAVGAILALGVTVMGLIDDRVSWRVGAVAGAAISGSIVAGTAAGTAIPMLMRRLGFDPAQSAAILLIMITDAVAFAAFLGLAWALFPWLAAGVEAEAAAAAASTATMLAAPAIDGGGAGLGAPASGVAGGG